MQPLLPSFDDAFRLGKRDVPLCGIDEAGRGPWAGPVVAAAVIFRGEAPPGIRDSKQLSAAQREALYGDITACAEYAIGWASVEEIDAMNILAASLLAMERAVSALSLLPAIALVDGNRLPKLSCPAHAVVQGDGKSLSIAAASILAKVTRDRLMAELGAQDPRYGFERHMGYGTKAHQEALRRFGATAHHRRSFAPIRALCESLAA